MDRERIDPVTLEEACGRIERGRRLLHPGQDLWSQHLPAALPTIPTHTKHHQRIGLIGGVDEQVDISSDGHACERGIPFDLAVIGRVGKLPCSCTGLQVLFHNPIRTCERNLHYSRTDEHEEQPCP